MGKGLKGWVQKVKGRRRDGWAGRWIGGCVEGRDEWMEAVKEESSQALNTRLRNPIFLRGSGNHCWFLSRGMAGCEYR